MSDAAFASAALAAGALAVEIAPGEDRLILTGDVQGLGLASCAEIGTVSAFTAAVAPGDRGALVDIGLGGAFDARLRLIGDDHEVRYVRLKGVGDGQVWTGLLLPAGASPDGGLARLDLESALNAAISSGAVLAHHQPVVDLASRTLAGFEALARWERPQGGLLGADDFLPLAEERGLTGAVGEAVRSAATRDLSAWRAARPEAAGLFVAANATAGELCAPGFAETLIAAVDSAGLPRGVFKLEINETEVMRDPDAAAAALKQVKAAGIALVLDDFGTGYSSLARLDRFPFDVVKIDQYFVRAAATDASARAIIASVVRIAGSYGMTVVAEGVETEMAAELCTELGCDLGQGFRFAGALAPADAAQAVTHGIDRRFKPAGA